MYDFTYHKPTQIDDAVKALGADPEAKALAGGMTYVPVLKQRLAKPTAIVDLGGVGMVGIRREGNAIVIGAMTTHREVAMSKDIAEAIPGISYMASNIGDRQVRYRGTIGGSLANNDPSACYPSAVLALGATIKTTKRSIPADQYFQGMFSTALEPGELITEVSFPIPEKSAYAKFPNPASRYATVGVFVAKTAQGPRVAVTGAGSDGVFRHTAMEQALEKSFTPDTLKDVTTPETNMNADIHASAAYRAHLVGVMARRAVEACNTGPR